MSVSSEVLKAINLRLREVFPSVNVYNDTTEQGVIEPCFLVRVLSESPKSRLEEIRWATRFNVEITYLHTDVKQKEIQDVRENLLFSLNDWKCFDGDGYLRAENANTLVQMENDALVYTAEFVVPMFREAPKAESMQKPEIRFYIDDLPEIVKEEETLKEAEMWKLGEGDDNKNGIPDAIEKPADNKSNVDESVQEKKEAEDAIMSHLRQFGRIR